MVVYALHERQMAHNSWQSTRPSLLAKTINTFPRTLANTVYQCCWGFLRARTPCQCQWDRGTIVFMHEMPLSGSQVLTAQLVDLLEQSLQRIGRVPPDQNLVLSIHSWKVVWSSQENTHSQEQRTHIQGLGPGNTTFHVQPSRSGSWRKTRASGHFLTGTLTWRLLEQSYFSCPPGFWNGHLSSAGYGLLQCPIIPLSALVTKEARGSLECESHLSQASDLT